MSGVSLGHYWGKQHQDLKKSADGNEKTKAFSESSKKLTCWVLIFANHEDEHSKRSHYKKENKKK